MSGVGTGDGGARPIALDFSETVYIDGPVEASVQTNFPYAEPDITQIAALVTLSGDIPDDRAEWHHNYTHIKSWMGAHILREAKGWSIERTAKQLAKERDMPQMLGFFKKGPVAGDPGDPPSYTQLRDMWEETFTDRHRGAVKVIAERLVEYCRENGFPAPEDVFVPDDDIEVEEPTEDDPDYTPLVTASRFLAVAEGMFGLGPKPPPD